ncbi:hypothetical protein BTO04_14125 [Polaribacter sp. SA4-10]|uniref:energy transducer TonB n=1 Tax=Polaribacter sp. SA4-10 TaxID=754397 RepID=UPI000B3C0592|nr:energy transducer TonB [Polaribacter sp. SA4-10]ARV07760.1 hypothetical protein BTO04_14125 [Polaribacter sp. SA4-10]
MKKIVVLTVLMLISFLSIGQTNSYYKVGDTLYYQNNRATYLRTDTFVILKEANLNNLNSFKVEKYVLESNSNKYALDSKFITNGLQELISNGVFTSYHKNGEKSSEGETLNGRKADGLWTYFYENGKKRSEEKRSKETFFNDNKVLLVMSFWDAKGDKTVENGNGFCEFVSPEDGYTHKGRYKNGFKNGSWTAYKGKVKVFEETHKNGRLLKGTSWNDIKESFNYKKVFTEAYYKKQVKAYVRKYVSRKFESSINRAEGNIIITFDISKEGNISNLFIVKGLTQEHNSEVKRIILEMEKWVPAKKRGQSFASKYKLTLNFKE